MTWHEERCRGAAAVEFARYRSLDVEDPSDLQLLSDICTAAVAKLSEDWQDTPPNEVPQSDIEEALTDAIEASI